ncbi:MAG: PilZ domain-containing protein [Candidatus Koribacter versatilis]|uniref:PilZ domain-containing protein n=1 Tax=Candidatus Korobacter versatilis TaxID=658062 RepID=A0A932A9B2_9BACT|nr:PilZ domain-containing protein [Candidatus Koribacter versatilis]
MAAAQNKENRRAFERFPISEHAVATDEKGAMLGHVSTAGGGGMTIHADSAAIAEALAPGRKLTVTVVEPDNKVSNTVDVEVRYRKGAEIGVQFITAGKK